METTVAESPPNQENYQLGKLGLYGSSDDTDVTPRTKSFGRHFPMDEITQFERRFGECSTPSEANACPNSTLMSPFCFGPYLLLGRSQGGLGVVYKAYDRTLSRMVAIKFHEPKGSQSNQDAIFARTLREAKALARLNHENLVRLHQVGQAGRTHFLEMEYIDGISLSQRAQNNAITLDQACDYITQTAQGMAHAHSRGVIHGDLHHTNLLVNDHGQIKVIGFGNARFSWETPDISGLENEQSDICSLGHILRFLVSGPTSQDYTEMPASLEKVYAKMTAKESRRRYQTMADVVEALQPFVKNRLSIQVEKRIHSQSVLDSDGFRADQHNPNQFAQQLKAIANCRDAVLPDRVAALMKWTHLDPQSAAATVLDQLTLLDQDYDWLCEVVAASVEVYFESPESQQQAKQALLRIAMAHQFDQRKRANHLVWTAIRRAGSLMDPKDLAELIPFLNSPQNPQASIETRLATLMAIESITSWSPVNLDQAVLHAINQLTRDLLNQGELKQATDLAITTHALAILAQIDHHEWDFRFQEACRLKTSVIVLSELKAHLRKTVEQWKPQINPDNPRLKKLGKLFDQVEKASSKTNV